MSMTEKQHVDMWLKGSSEAMTSMRLQLKGKQRTFAMFMGHFAVEKALKAVLVCRKVPTEKWSRGVRGHKLDYLSELAKLQLTVDELTELVTITSFNMNARYDDYKRAFHALCTPQYTSEWSKRINAWYKKLRAIAVEERKKLPNNSPSN
jgi:HEPN domain-containing protein